MSTTNWIEHDGKGMPVDANTRVEVRFRDGMKQVGSAIYWGRDDYFKSQWFFDPVSPGWDIIAYRLAT